MKRKAFEEMSRKDLEDAIDMWVIGKRHSARNREILKRSLFDGVTYERIAEEYGLSTRQVANIIYKTEEQLFKHV